MEPSYLREIADAAEHDVQSAIWDYSEVMRSAANEIERLKAEVDHQRDAWWVDAMSWADAQCRTYAMPRKFDDEPRSLYSDRQQAAHDLAHIFRMERARVTGIIEARNAARSR